MGVLKRGKSRYWYIQFQFNGRTYIKSSRTTDKRTAEQMERKWRNELHDQVYSGRKERITIQVSFDLFCESRKNTPNHKNLLSLNRVFKHLINVNQYIDELTSENLERLKQQRFNDGYSPATIIHTINFIRGTIKHVKRMGYQVPDIEYPTIKPPKHRLRYLSHDEEKRLLVEINPRREGSGLPVYTKRSEKLQRELQDIHDIVVVLLDTGARYSEITGLQWSRVNLIDKTISLWRSKVQNESVLFMTDRVCRILSRRQVRRSSDFVFTNSTGGQRGESTRSIRNAIKRSGLIDVTVHTFRHTHASRLIQNGMSIYEVKEILGHSDIKTTMRYAHLEQRDVSRRAREIINQINTETEKPTLKVV